MKLRRYHLKKLLLFIFGMCATTLTTLHLHLTKQFQQQDNRVQPSYEPNQSVQRSINNQTQQQQVSQIDWTSWIQSIFPQKKSSGNCIEPRLWSTGVNETEDRILNQLNFSLPNFTKNITGNSKEQDGLKKILVFSGSRNPGGRSRFLADECPVNNCFMTTDRKQASSADAVLFSQRASSPLPTKRPGQIWIMYILESPVNTAGITNFRDQINISATYRTDSTLVTPYEAFIRKKNESLYQLHPSSKNYAKGKTLKVAWFVSNCNARNNRREYAQELAKYINVDIYGRCGKLSCPRNGSNYCFERLKHHYKFYLSFENSNCKDYITEKFYWNALLNDVLPIVMGAHPDDYARAAPLNSYLHVDNFTSPKHLAEYLHLLDKNDDLYNNYFRWKGSGHFINTKFYCRLCAMINDGSRLSWYGDFHSWWNGPGVCVKSTVGNKFASWKSTLPLWRNDTARKISMARFDPHYVHLHTNSETQGHNINGCN